MERVDLNFRETNIEKLKKWWNKCFRNENQLIYIHTSTIALHLVIL